MYRVGREVCDCLTIRWILRFRFDGFTSSKENAAKLTLALNFWRSKFCYILLIAKTFSRKELLGRNLIILLKNGKKSFLVVFLIIRGIWKLIVNWNSRKIENQLANSWEFLCIYGKFEVFIWKYLEIFRKLFQRNTKLIHRYASSKGSRMNISFKNVQM